jgi:hypothetical protein
MRKLTLVVLIVFVSACNDSSSIPTAPTPNISGAWAGTIAGTAAGSGALSLALAEGGVIGLPPDSGLDPSRPIGGTWSSSFSNAVNDSGGNLSGFIDGSSVTATLTPSAAGQCTVSITATMTSSTSMSGTYVLSGCPTSANGTISLVKK